jgi:hypothetical protein
MFLITFALNYISLYVFWKEILKQEYLAFLSGMILCFLLIRLQLGHFQMMFFWPFFLCLYFVFINEKRARLKNLIYAGILLSVQFLGSVYISIFLTTALGIFYFVSFVFSQNKLQPIKNLTVILLIFLAVDAVFIKGYLDMKSMYQIKRSINEYIGYSAHLTDYFFVSNNLTLLYSTGITARWEQLNKHIVGERAMFPGFALTILGALSLLVIKKEKSAYSIRLNFDRTRLFFLLILMCGFVFSLGPRISFNGNYSHLPNLYGLPFKVIPLFEAVRAPVRWSYLFYIGVIFFALSYFSSIRSKTATTIKIAIVVFLVLEYIPLPITTHAEGYLSPDHNLLRQRCSQEKKVVLELPVTHFGVKSNKGIIEGLNYITKIELASVYHQCDIVNGYSGYDLPHLIDLDVNLNKCFAENSCDEARNQLDKIKIDYVKVNQDKMNTYYPSSLEMLFRGKRVIPLSSTLFQIK